MEKRSRNRTRRKSLPRDQNTVLAGVARDSHVAWRRLLEAGGLEPDQRDSGFVDALRARLSPTAATIEDALRAATTDDLVRAFFDLVQPYVAMFRAIMDFFQAAGAREGREQWEIHIDEEHLDLRHFQRFLEHWNVLEYDLNVPALDARGGWAVFEAGRDIPALQGALDFLRGPEGTSTGYSDVNAWLNDYRDGRYGPFPASLHPSRVPPELGDAAGITLTAVELIRSRWPDRDAMRRDHAARGYRQDYADGFSLDTIAQNESDFCLGSSVAQLARYASLNDADRAHFSANLMEILSPYPRRLIGLRAKWPELERILSLPLWRKRNELYVVWIATEIVDAVNDHDVELHHENGRIVFAFRETVVATIHSTRPEVRLYAERRTPLVNPIGQGRSGNVQPDYSLWRGKDGQESCGLVVEVKHYLLPSPGRFREVLIDYGRAHANAKVVLVNHGHTGRTDKIPSAITDRCHVIGDLTVSHLPARGKLRGLVRDYVGPPVRAIGNAILAIDISMSMAQAVRGLEESDLLAELAEKHASPSVAFIDTAVRHICEVENAAAFLRQTKCDEGTTLTGPLAELLEQYGKVVLVTDAEGVCDVPGTPDRVESCQVGGAHVEIVEVSASET
jgi:hypothetical protein